MVGFGSADVPKSAIISSLLIVGLADNLTDTLSIHIFRVSELLEQRAAFRATVSNFLTRACIAGSFVVLMLLLSGALAILSCLVWGIALLVCLTHLVARNRGASVTSEFDQAHFACSSGNRGERVDRQLDRKPRALMDASISS